MLCASQDSELQLKLWLEQFCFQSNKLSYLSLAAAAVCFRDDNIVVPADRLSALKRFVASVSASSSAEVYSNFKFNEVKKVRSVTRPRSFGHQ